MARHACGTPTVLRSTEGVGAELHRVTRWRRVAGPRSRGVAESQHIAQARSLGGGGEARHASRVCGYDVRRDDGGMAKHRAGRRCAGRRGADGPP